MITNRRRTNRDNNPTFRWRAGWYDFLMSLPTDEEQSAMFSAISQYALYGAAPNLQGKAALYFASEIKPDLDKCPRHPKTDPFVLTEK